MGQRYQTFLLHVVILLCCHRSISQRPMRLLHVQGVTPDRDIVSGLQARNTNNFGVPLVASLGTVIDGYVHDMYLGLLAKNILSYM